MKTNFIEVREVLKKLNLSQYDLAEEAKIPRSRIQLIWQGRLDCSKDDFFKIQKAIKTRLKEKENELCKINSELESAKNSYQKEVWI